MNQFFYFFFVFFVSILLFLLVGEALFRVLAVKNRFSLQTIFRNVLTGYIFSITVYSLFKTSGTTVNALYVLLFIFGAIETRRFLREREEKLTSELAPILPVIGLCAIGLSCVFIWSWFASTSDNSQFLFNYNNGDYILYSRIARSIGEIGQENGFYALNNLDEYYRGAEPYHYFDLWGGSLISLVFSIDTLLALKLVVYPIFYFLVFIAFGALLQQRFEKVIIGLLLLFLSGVYLNFYDASEFTSALRNLTHGLLSTGMNKLSYFYVFFYASYLLYLKRAFVLSTLVLLGLPIANIITFPIFGAILLFAIVGGYSKPDFKKVAIYLPCIVFGLFLFYFFFKGNALGLAGAQISSPLDLIIANLKAPEWRTRFNVIVGGGLDLIIIYLPILSFIIATHYFFTIAWRVHLPVLLFSFFEIMLVLFLWSLMFKELNSSQVFSNTGIVLMNFLAAIFIIQICNSVRSKYVLSIVVVFLSYQAYGKVESVLKNKRLAHSPEYLTKISNLVKEMKLIRGVSLKDSSLLVSPFNKYNAAYPLGDYLTIINEKVYIVNIGDFNTPIDSSSSMNLDRSVKALQNGIFYRYVRNRQSNKSDIEELQNQFIKDYDMQFLIFSSGLKKHPKWLRGDEIIVRDSMTGESFVVLNSSSKEQNKP